MRGLVQTLVVVAVLVSACDSSQATSTPARQVHSPSSQPTTHSTIAARPCARVEFDHHAYRLTKPPPGAGPGVGRILGAGRTVDCHGAAGERVRIYSVNEESPAQSITISQNGKVRLYTR